MSKIRVAELFAGYGSQSMALERLKRDYPEFDYEVVLISEIEPNALKAYEATHGYCPNVGDISQVVWSEQPDFDLATWSFPCTDISGAGKQMGLSKDSGTRSSLCWEAIRCFKAKRPKYLLMENVSALAQKKFIKDFHALQYELEQIGYTNFCAILDSSKYGVPQHRERLFMISILDCTKSYHFPEPFKLEKRIKDILEPYGTVDESFYFSPKQLASMFDYCDKKKSEGCGFQTQFTDGSGIASCVTTRYGASYTDAYLKEPSLQQRLSIYADNAQAGRVYDVEGISPCLDTCSGGNRMPKILEPCILTPQRTEEAKELRRKGIEVFGHRELVPREDGVSNTITTVQKDNLLAEPCILGYTRDKKGKVVDYHDKDVANTVHTLTGGGWNTDQFVKEPIELSLTNLPDKTVLKDEDGRGYLWQDGSLWRVRKLTGLEVMRLMNVADEDYYKIKDAGISKTAIYSLAGNSIVVAVLYHIFRKLWIDTECESAQKSLFDF